MSLEPNPYTSRRAAPPAPRGGDGLADVLERVLDRGLVIAGDIQVNLLDIELLTVKVRLLLASADTAQQMGIDWWQSDPFLSSSAKAEQDAAREDDNAALQRRVAELEEALSQLRNGDEPAALEEGDDRG